MLRRVTVCFLCVKLLKARMALHSPFALIIEETFEYNIVVANTEVFCHYIGDPGFKAQLRFYLNPLTT